MPAMLVRSRSGQGFKGALSSCTGSGLLQSRSRMVDRYDRRARHEPRTPSTVGDFMPIWLQTALLLLLSNTFMTYAWYGHLKDLSTQPWYLAAIAAWSVAFFEYQF